MIFFFNLISIPNINQRFIYFYHTQILLVCSLIHEVSALGVISLGLHVLLTFGLTPNPHFYTTSLCYCMKSIKVKHLIYNFTDRFKFIIETRLLFIFLGLFCYIFLFVDDLILLFGTFVSLIYFGANHSLAITLTICILANLELGIYNKRYD